MYEYEGKPFQKKNARTFLSVGFFSTSSDSNAVTGVSGRLLNASDSPSSNFRLYDIVDVELSAVFLSVSLLCRENLTVCFLVTVLSTVTSSDLTVTSSDLYDLLLTEVVADSELAPGPDA